MKKIKISYTGSRNAELPYEKFLHHGADILTDAELLAIMIRTGTASVSALELGRKILDLPAVREHGLNGLHRLSLKELTSIHGIGEVKAVRLKCLAELSMRMAVTSAEKSLCFHNPASVAGYYMERLRHETKECVFLLLLDSKEHLLGEELLSVGTVNASMLSPREVFITALKAEAVHIILLHNHPSGDPAPSRQDREITEQIRQIGGMIGIPLIDHIIIGDNRYMSFREAGLL